MSATCRAVIRHWEKVRRQWCPKDQVQRYPPSARCRLGTRSSRSSSSTRPIGASRSPGREDQEGPGYAWDGGGDAPTAVRSFTRRFLAGASVCARLGYAHRREKCQWKLSASATYAGSPCVTARAKASLWRSPTTES